MRALRPMTQEERDFAEQHHNLVIDFLRYRRLPMDEFYDVVIFGYLSAVQQYFRKSRCHKNHPSGGVYSGESQSPVHGAAPQTPVPLLS